MLILPMLFWCLLLKGLAGMRNKTRDFSILRFYLGEKLFRDVKVSIFQLGKFL